jgi:hypothetical protein
MKGLPFRIVVAATIALATVALHAAATVTIEPDDYAGFIKGAPNVRFYTVRPNDAYDGLAFHNVQAVGGGSWSPTGHAVFGFVPRPGELSSHWDNMIGAWTCYAYRRCPRFRVFGAYFRESVETVTVLTTMRGEVAIDPVELMAFRSNGDRILRCRLDGVSNRVLVTAVLPPPVDVDSPSGATCGQVLERRNCSGQPGNCDYVVQMRAHRKIGDIAFVWFGGQLHGNSYAHVDRLSYSVPGSACWYC